MRLVTERANHHALKAVLSAHLNQTNLPISLVSGEQPRLEGHHPRPLFNCNEMAVGFFPVEGLESSALLEWEEDYFTRAVHPLYTQRQLTPAVTDAFKGMGARLPSIRRNRLAETVFWCAALPALCDDGLLPDEERAQIPDVVEWFALYNKSNEHAIAEACSELGAQEPTDFLRVRCAYRMTPCQTKPFLVTTPIYYVNAAPHIGHVYSTLVADAVARYHRAKGETVFFTTGTDEHGQKVAQAAEKLGKTPQEFTDGVAAEFRKCFEEMRFSYDHFIRTTDEAHEKSVQEIWTKLEATGDIYIGKYQGWYCISDEAFLTDLNVKDGVNREGVPCKVSIESGNECKWVEEENYMFRLSKFQEPILKWLKENPRSVVPEFRRREVIKFVEGGLLDLSISRKKSTCQWGVAIPGSEEHVMYVWLDALSNYFTSSRLGKDGELLGWNESGRWPADLHVLGKDINKFHAVYWPAFLFAAGLEPPTSLVVHGWWTKDKQKISKSLGNGFDPIEKANEFGHDALKYFLLRESSFCDDGDYSDRNMILRLNSELADTLGNLVMRCTAEKINEKQEWPEPNELNEKDRRMIQAMEALGGTVDHYFLIPDIQRALISVFDVLRMLNTYTTETAPWTLKKTDEVRLATVLRVIMEGVRICVTLLQPVLCDAAPAILTQLGVPQELWTHWEKSNALTFGRIPSGTPLGPATPEAKFNKKDVPIL